MARFSSFLGRRVEVQYRASDTLLPASGVFVADSGRSIFLEQSFEQRGQHRHFRWEIPYQHLVRIGLIFEDEEERRLPSGKSNSSRTAPEETLDRGAATSDSASSSLEAARSDPQPQPPPKEKLAAGAAAGMGLVAAVLPLANRSKTA
jgi:hypothetical protein